MLEDEIEDQMKRCASFKEAYSNIVSQVQNLNHKLEEIDNVKKSNKNLKNEIHKKNKEIGYTLMKFVKMKELHKDALLKIKVCDEEIDKKDGIIDDFIDNIQ